MGYPGDQGRSGGRPPEPPTPYGPGAEPNGPEQAGVGHSGQDDSPFTPPPGAFAARPGESFDAGGDQSLSEDRFGAGEGGRFGPPQGGRFASGTGGFGTAPGGQFGVGEPGRFAAGTGTGGFDSVSPGTDGSGTGGFDTVAFSAGGPGAGGSGTGGFSAGGPGAGGSDTGGFGAMGGPGAGGFGPEGFDSEGRFGQDPGGPYGPGSFEQQGPASFGPPGDHERGQGGPGQGRPGAGSFDGPGEELYGSTGERYFAADGGPGGHGGPAGFDRPGERPRSERRTRLPLIIGGAVAAGLLLVGGGFAVSSMLKDDSEGGKAAASTAKTPKTTATPTPTAPPVPLNAKLKSRATDPNPLTLKEVFGTAAFTQKGRKYVRTAWKHDRSCAKTVNGSKLEAALKKGGCVQVLRATYARADGLLIGTVGVLNLKTESAAKAAEKAGSGREAFLQPLAGTGYTKKIGKGAALGTTFVRGHYLIMTWVQRPDGKTISSKYHKVVSAFQQQVILGSNLNKALHYRGIEGKPLTS